MLDCWLGRMKDREDDSMCIPVVAQAKDCTPPIMVVAVINYKSTVQCSSNANRLFVCRG